MFATKWKESLFSKEQMFLIELIANELSKNRVKIVNNENKLCGLHTELLQCCYLLQNWRILRLRISVILSINRTREVVTRPSC